jgi:hypothetical protein
MAVMHKFHRDVAIQFGILISVIVSNEVMHRYWLPTPWITDFFRLLMDRFVIRIALSAAMPWIIIGEYCYQLIDCSFHRTHQTHPFITHHIVDDTPSSSSPPLTIAAATNILETTIPSASPMVRQILVTPSIDNDVHETKEQKHENINTTDGVASIADDQIIRSLDDDDNIVRLRRPSTPSISTVSSPHPVAAVAASTTEIDTPGVTTMSELDSPTATTILVVPHGKSESPSSRGLSSLWMKQRTGYVHWLVEPFIQTHNMVYWGMSLIHLLSYYYYHIRQPYSPITSTIPLPIWCLFAWFWFALWLAS